MIDRVPWVQSFPDLASGRHVQAESLVFLVRDNRSDVSGAARDSRGYGTVITFTLANEIG
jgi:hypothetical protein